MCSSTPIHRNNRGSCFMDKTFKLHGIPHSIVSDQDPNFTSNFWQEVFRLQGTLMQEHRHQHSMGQVEDNSVSNARIQNVLDSKGTMSFIVLKVLKLNVF
jgi:hypothetical protein